MKKIGFVILVIVLLLIINSLSHSIFDLWQKKSLVTSAQKELEFQKLKNSKLKGELSYVKSQQFVDEAARDKLFLAKPGEQRVIISKDLITPLPEKTRPKEFSNPQKWLNLFF